MVKTDPEIIIEQLTAKNYEQASLIMKFENKWRTYKWFIEESGLNQQFEEWCRQKREPIMLKEIKND